MSLSPMGLSMLRRLEGQRLTVYLDSRGKPTIGVGHLLIGPYRPDLKWTAEEALAQLALDVQPVVSILRAQVEVRLSQPQFDALVCLIFNIGRMAFLGSTLLKALNNGEYSAAAEQFLAWSKQPELRPRRAQERAVFLYGTA